MCIGMQSISPDHMHADAATLTLAARALEMAVMTSVTAPLTVPSVVVPESLGDAVLTVRDDLYDTEMGAIAFPATVVSQKPKSVSRSSKNSIEKDVDTHPFTASATAASFAADRSEIVSAKTKKNKKAESRNTPLPPALSSNAEVLALSPGVSAEPLRSTASAFCLFARDLRSSIKSSVAGDLLFAHAPSAWPSH
jgi:hypothetical protein